MSVIKFVPQNQKNLEHLEGSQPKKNGNNLIYILITLFVIYSAVVVGGYWFFVVQEKNKVSKAIQELDNSNSQYYISDDLEQGLFNIKDLVDKSYDPTIAIKEIESSYVPGAKITSFTYSKASKTINIAMGVTSIKDVTFQIDRFNELNSVIISNYSAVNADNADNDESLFLFGVEIVLK